MHSFKSLFLQFFRIAVFKSPPQELPTSDQVLVVAISMSVLVGLARYFVVGAEYYSMFRVLIELIVPGVLVYAMLLFFKKPNRFAQTFAAICGSGAIIYAIALPVFPSFHAATQAAGMVATETATQVTSQSSANNSQLAVYIIIAIDLWSVAVLAYIIKHAVEVGFATGISLAVALVLVSLMLVEGITPSKAPSVGADPLSMNSVPPVQRSKISALDE